jgi:hypothetical protein
MLPRLLPAVGHVPRHHACSPARDGERSQYVGMAWTMVLAHGAMVPSALLA